MLKLTRRINLTAPKSRPGTYLFQLVFTISEDAISFVIKQAPIKQTRNQEKRPILKPAIYYLVDGKFEFPSGSTISGNLEVLGKTEDYYPEISNVMFSLDISYPSIEGPLYAQGIFEYNDENESELDLVEEIEDLEKEIEDDFEEIEELEENAEREGDSEALEEGSEVIGVLEEAQESLQDELKEDEVKPKVEAKKPSPRKKVVKKPNPTPKKKSRKK